jgi:hypothetical protein
MARMRRVRLFRYFDGIYVRLPRTFFREKTRALFQYKERNRSSPVRLGGRMGFESDKSRLVDGRSIKRDHFAGRTTLYAERLVSKRSGGRV